MAIDHETTVSYDYEEHVVRLFTTREAVITGLKKRLGAELFASCTYRSTGPYSHYLTLPMNLCRAPQMLVSMKNPELKGTFPTAL
jgi:hypothetical protein